MAKKLEMPERNVLSEWTPDCLKCRKPFVSPGKHVRICRKCNADNDRMIGYGRNFHQSVPPPLGACVD